jgi:hypothetical protein
MITFFFEHATAIVVIGGVCGTGLAMFLIAALVRNLEQIRKGILWPLLFTALFVAPIAAICLVGWWHVWEAWK